MGAARTSSTDSFLERIKYSATKLARKAKKMNKNVVLTTSGGVPAISAMPLASACEAQRVTRTRKNHPFGLPLFKLLGDFKLRVHLEARA